MSATPRRPFAWLLCILAAVALGACTSRATGLDGELVFSYPSPVDPLNFNKPVAVGARLDVTVVEVGAERDITLTAVESSNPAVLAVTALDTHEFLVQARSPGDAELWVRARTEDGGDVSDRIALRAAHADRLHVVHPCSPDQPEGTYLAGRTVFLYREMARDTGEPVVGWDYLPLQVEPSDAVLIDLDREQSLLGLHLPRRTGRVTLTSTLEPITWTLRLVEPAAVDALQLEYAPSRAFVGDETFMMAAPRVDGAPLCQHDLELEATSHTPSLCTVRPGPRGSEVVEIDALAYGICRYEVGFGDARHQLTLAIGKLPGPDEDNGSLEDALAAAAPERPTWLRLWPTILGLVLLSQLLIGALWWRLRRSDLEQQG